MLFAVSCLFMLFVVCCILFVVSSGPYLRCSVLYVCCICVVLCCMFVVCCLFVAVGFFADN